MCVCEGGEGGGGCGGCEDSPFLRLLSDSPAILLMISGPEKKTKVHTFIHDVHVQVHSAFKSTIDENFKRS